MKRCSTTLAVREVQIKTTVSCDHTPIRMAKIKTVTTRNAGEDDEKQDPFCIAVGMGSCTAALVNNLVVSDETKHAVAL